MSPLGGVGRQYNASLRALIDVSADALTRIDCRMQTSASLESILLRPSIFSQPMRMVWPPSWVAHVPFAFWLVDVLKPRVLVELGTHTGNSYAAFAQAVQMLDLSTACYAVDTWKGDHQAGFYDELVFEEWRAFHDAHFAAFSRLIRSTFDEALSNFADRSIDILHIDGLHTYDAVRHDFDTWLRKVSPRGVILLHDVNVREGDFGVWRLWDEIRHRYPTFTFLHAHGLGVAAVGVDVPAEIRWLVSSADSVPQTAQLVRRIFGSIGGSLERQLQLDLSKQETRELQARLAAVEASARQELDSLRAASSAATSETREIRLELDTHLAAEQHLERQLALKRSELELYKSELERLRGKHAELAVQHDRAITRANRLERELQRDRESLEYVESERAASDYDASKLQVRLVDLETELRHANTSLAVVRQELERMRRSRVWRLTAPIRRAKRIGLGRLLSVRHPRGLRSVARAAARPRQLAEIRQIELSGLFDERFYLESYPDVRQSGAPPIVHYMLTGAREGRLPHPLFDTAFYLRQNADVRESGVNPLAHYVMAGAREGRDPHPLFSSACFHQFHPQAALLGSNPLVHFMREGGRTFATHPLFDPEYYLDRNPDIRNAGANPLVHFVTEGGREGRSPHPLFDAEFYLRRNPDVRESGANPLVHFLQRVPDEDRDPHPLFDVSYYMDASPDLRAGRLNPLVHFVQHGWREGRRPNAIFDPVWYLAMNQDVAMRGLNPLAHFATFGWREGRDPGPEFSTSGYLREHPDIGAASINPLAHYLASGRHEGRTAPPSSNPRLPAPRVVTLRAHGVSAPEASPEGRTLVCVTHVVPWPARAGNEYRVLRMLEWLARHGHRILLLLAPLPSVSVSDAQLDELAARLGNVALCDRDGTITYRLRSMPDVFRGLTGIDTRRFANILGERASGTPRERELLNVDRTFCHDALIETTLRVLDSLDTSVLLVEYVWMSRLLSLAHGRVPTLLDTHDMFSRKAGYVQSYGIDEASLSGEEEATRLARADVVIAIQDRERELMQRLVPDSDVITAGVDFDIVERPGIPDPHTLLMVASANAMNRLGLLDFLRFAWPSVLARVPDARLLVAGQVGTVIEEDTPNVEALGVVADLAPLYARARVVINPAAAGTGLKIKTVEALSHLRPVVTWPNGLDGVPETIRAGMPPVNDWYEFADRIVEHLTSTQPALDPTVEAAVRKYLSADEAYAALNDRLARAFERAAARRQR